MQNRAASPDAGGWSFVAIVPLKKGANTLRLEHETRFPYFEKLLIAPAHNQHTPLTTVQIANQYGVNPGYLIQLVEYLERSNGATLLLYAWEILGSGNAESGPHRYANFHRSAGRRCRKRFRPVTSAVPAGGKRRERHQRPGNQSSFRFLKEKFGPFRAPANVRRYYPVEFANR